MKITLLIKKAINVHVYLFINKGVKLRIFRKPPWPQVHKFYFVFSLQNGNEQFFYFISMVSPSHIHLDCIFIGIINMLETCQLNIHKIFAHI